LAWVLIGKVGETGTPFVTGDSTTVTDYLWRERSATEPSGLLYLRINDDILSDNQGAVDIQVVVLESVAYYYGKIALPSETTQLER